MKKQKKNRIIAAALALCLCLSVSPAQSGIQGYAYSTEILTVSDDAYGELEYYNHGDCIEIRGCKSDAERIEIPSEIDGIPVEIIGAFAFSKQLNKSLANVKIMILPDTVRWIQENAFSRLESLEEMTIPDSVVQIDSGAFQGCDALRSIHLPAHLRRIPANCFSGSDALEICNIPPEIECVGAGAFASTALSSLTLPDSVLRIEEKAFLNCTSLTELHLGSRVENIGDQAFSNTRLTALKLPDSLRILGKSVFDASPVQEINLPKSLTQAEWSSFPAKWLERYLAEHEFLIVGTTLVGAAPASAEVTIPDGITRIEAGAFQENQTITTLILPDSLLSIGEEAFYRAKNLEHIQGGQSVERIEKSAFYQTALPDVFLPASLQYLGADVFEDTPWQITTYGERNAGNITETMYAGGWLMRIPAGTLTVDIKEGTIGIAESAARNCQTLREITIPDTVRFIGDYALCSNITPSIEIPEGVEWIGNYAFANTALRTITIPSTVSHLGSGVFRNCTSLESADIRCALMEIPDELFHGCKALRICKIPEGTVSIGFQAFANCNALQPMTIPDTVEYLEDWCFFNCNQFHDVVIPKNVVYIGSKAFDSCFGLRSVTVMNPDCVFDEEQCYIFGSGHTPTYVISYFPGILHGYACSTLHDYALWNSLTFEPFVRHDLNADGALDTLDIILLQKYLLSSQSFSKAQFLEADMNADGVVDVFDLALMKREVSAKS